MTHPWDEFSKSLAESVPRRESLRRMGAAFAGAALMPFSLALGAPKRAAPDPCKAFCNQCPKSQRSQCLAACQACSGNTSRLCGTCGNYACCASGLACCGGACVDLIEDYYNCGGCGNACDELGPYEDGACVDGTCFYKCVDGALLCNGACIPVLGDPNNCGACGNVCGEATPICDGGTCWDCESYGLTTCGGRCTDALWDSSNCGGCGNVCGGSTPYCSAGVCIRGDEPCPGGGTRCNGVCTNLSFDTLNCGGCGIVCGDGETCSGGVCQSPW